MPVPTLDSHPITSKGLRALCTAVLKTKSGDAWDVTNFNLRVKQLEAFATHTGLYDPEPGSIVDCTYGALFAGQNDEHKSPVDWIKDWIASPGDLLPPNSLSNVLSIRCTLDAPSAVTANQQLLVVCVHDSLWTMQYAPPAELAIETKVSPIT